MEKDPMLFWLSIATASFIFLLALYFVIKWAVRSANDDLYHQLRLQNNLKLRELKGHYEKSDLDKVINETRNSPAGNWA